MSRFHVDPDARVPIYEDESDLASNCIVVRARMNLETAGRVQSEMAKRNAVNQTQGHIGVVAVALLLHNILEWRGPDFDDLPCTPANICALPPPELDPFIEKVVNRLGELNERKVAPNPKSPTANGLEISTLRVENPANEAGISLQLATGIPKSPLRSALDGRLTRSGD